MREMFSGSMITVAIAGAAVGVISLSVVGTQAQDPAASGTALAAAALKTPWGEPDLQGIWTDETDTPLQRSAKYASQEFFTAAQREELDRERSLLLRRDKRVGAAAASGSDHAARDPTDAGRRSHDDGGCSSAWCAVEGVGRQNCRSTGDPGRHAAI